MFLGFSVFSHFCCNKSAIIVEFLKILRSSERVSRLRDFTAMDKPGRNWTAFLHCNRTLNQVSEKQWIHVNTHHLTKRERDKCCSIEIAPLSCTAIEHPITFLNTDTSRYYFPEHERDKCCSIAPQQKVNKKIPRSWEEHALMWKLLSTTCSLTMSVSVVWLIDSVTKVSVGGLQDLTHKLMTR